MAATAAGLILGVVTGLSFGLPVYISSTLLSMIILALQEMLSLKKFRNLLPVFLIYR
jgi:hypothetical protein